jgi:hypothetical protein
MKNYKPMTIRIPNSYKLTLAALVAAIVGLNACPKAKADLGDTYQLSCQKFGSKGHVDKQYKSITWYTHHHYIVESFVNNECVSMFLLPDKDRSYTVADMQRMLPYNCGSNQLWAPVAGDDNFVVCWITTDGLITAGLRKDGSCIFVYSNWMQAKFGQTNTQAPIEDNPI